MINDKVAVITGGSGGVGKALALYLANKVGKVIVCYHSNDGQASSVKDEIVQLGGLCDIYRLDVSDPLSVKSVFEQVTERDGKVDVLINAAGVSFNGMSWKLPEHCWQQTLAVNLSGVFHCSQAVLPGMREREWGRIISFSSIVAHTGVAGTVAYAASKAGLEGMTRVMAAETAAKKITVNAIALGYFNTGMISQVPEVQVNKLLQSIPAGRLGMTEEINQMVSYLCSDAAAYITGQTLHINGGLFLN